MKMPVPPAAIRPLLLTAPEKFDIVPEPPNSTLPAKMPRNAEIVPELVMPPEKTVS